jgi:hypothetical protein
MSRLLQICTWGWHSINVNYFNRSGCLIQIHFENELDLSDLFWVFLMRFLDLDVNWEFTTRKIKFHSIYILGDVRIIRHVSRGVNKILTVWHGGGVRRRIKHLPIWRIKIRHSREWEEINSHVTGIFPTSNSWHYLRSTPPNQTALCTSCVSNSRIDWTRGKSIPKGLTGGQ